MSKIYCWDLDGCIAEERKTFERPLAAPKQDMIDIVNKLYDNGNTIIIYTARSWNEYSMTENWLKTNKVKYNLMMCGKPVADYYIDDRAININDVSEVLGDKNG